MTRHYNRSSVFQFSELSEEKQAHIKDTYFSEDSDAYSNSYVICDDQPIPLAMFERTEQSKLWNGIFPTSAFSAYFLKVSRNGEDVLVADRHF